MIEKNLFGTLPDGTCVYSFTLRARTRVTVEIINYGATVVSVFVPDRDGKFADVVLGYDELISYVNSKFFFGSVVGRYANRIANARFRLNGKLYRLTENENGNHLHGGNNGFHKVVWDAEPFEMSDEQGVELTYISNDKEEGYPGTLTTKVRYTLTSDIDSSVEKSALRIEYEAWTDIPTIVNLSNHTCFNLTGDPRRSIEDHVLMINADRYTPVDSNMIPSGELADVSDTPMDFRKPIRVGERIDSDNAMLKQCGGYDLNWVLNGDYKVLRRVAEVFEPSSGRLLEMFTDQPGLQFFTYNSLDGSERGKGGIYYNRRAGFALEAQLFPNSPNESLFPSPVLKPHEKYRQTTIYKFSAIKEKP
jgi:aldose 1-epimerase